MSLNYFSPTFLVIGCLMLVGWLLAKRSNFYGQLVAPNAKARYESLDGLRGFLAVGVLVHHGMTTYMWLTTNHWTLVGHPAFEMLGTLSVGLFFMITGFLFWGKVLADGGVHIRNHIRGRISRLAPMYLTVAGVAMVITLCSLWHDKIPAATGAKTAFTMLAMGIPSWFQPHGFDTGRIVAGVTWTLRYEWIFYAVLPLLVFIRNPKWIAAMTVGYVAYFVATTPHFAAKPFGPSFNLVGGMIVAQLMHAGAFSKVAWKSHWMAALMLITLAAMPMLVSRATPLVQFPLTLGLFLAIVNGNTLFGLLTAAGPKAIGTMSYSLYLLHGTVLYLAHPLLRSMTGSGVAYWGTLLGLGVLAVAISALTYRFIEHPFIELERARRKAGKTVPATKAVPIFVWPSRATPSIRVAA